MVDVPLINKYRPQAWEELVGNDAVFGSLIRALKGDAQPHAFLFTGPAGCGKTSTARILAAELGAEVLEIDAASYSGVDNARELVDLGNHRSLSGAGRRAFIIDECHTLSKPAWQALLKLLEEPPDHLFIMLCTTEAAKVPETIKTRCFPVSIRSVPAPELEQLVLAVAEAEGWELHGDVLAEVVRCATGSPRKALSVLQAVHGVGSREEVARIIQLQEASAPVIEVVQMLLKGSKSWGAVKPLLAKIGDDELASGMVEIARYIMAWMVNAKTDKDAERSWILLELLTQPIGAFDAKTIFYAAVGRMLWGA